MLTTSLRLTGPVIGAVDRPVSFTLGGSPVARIEPVTLDEVKAAQKISSTSEDTLLDIWIQAARAYFEEQTGRQIINATWEYALDQAPAWSVIELPRPPLFGVDSVVYDDGDGVEQTVDPDTYVVHKSGLLDGSPLSGVLDPFCGCGSIELKSGSTWPITSGLAQSFRIRRTCGYGDTAADVPGLIKGALFFLIGHYYSNRSETFEAASSRQTLIQIPLGAEGIIRAFKYSALPTLAPRQYTALSTFASRIR